METTSTNSTSNLILRLIALVIWVLIAAVYLIFFLLDLRLDFAQLQVPCVGESCNYLQISQAEVDVLEARGLSLYTYSIITVAASVFTLVIFWFLGILILWTQGVSRLGWSVSLFLIILPVSAISDANNVAANYPELFIPSILLSLCGTFILFLFLYIFPNGRFYPRWGFLPFLVTFFLFSVYLLEAMSLAAIPRWFLNFNFTVVISLSFMAVVLQIRRYRNVSSFVERQQTKWILFGLFILVFSFVFWFLIFGSGWEFQPGVPRLVAKVGGWVAIMFALCALPVTMSIAILRYRLWDIDLVIRRTLQYALLTGILALVYLGFVVVLQSFVSNFSGQRSSVVIVLSTLAIAALFNPLRHRTQDFIDRRFYRTRYDTQHALERFASTIRDEMDMDNLTSELLGLTQETLHPSQVSLWLKVDGDSRASSRQTLSS